MIITLLTDFGLRDNFVGVVKGVILGINPQARIVDISHGITPGDILQAAFLLESSYRYFPYGTIHLIIVDPGVGSGRKAIIVKTKNYYFVGPDNGVLAPSLEAEEKVIKIISITNQRFYLKPTSSTFHGRDIFAPVAAYLSCGRNISEFGVSQKDYRHLEFPRPVIGKKTLLGRIIYIDRFGNLVTNIPQDVFRRFVGKASFHIHLKNKIISQISKSYLDADKNKPLAIFGSSGNLEISISCGNAKNYFAARRGVKVWVRLV